MIELLGEHAFDDAHLVGHRLEIRHGIGHPDAALSVLREGAGRPHELGRTAGESESLALHKLIRSILPVPFHQLRLVVEDVEVRRAAGHLQVNDSLHFGAGSGGLGGEGIGVRSRRGAGAPLQRLHGYGSDAELPRSRQELAAGLVLEGFEMRVHKWETVSASSGFRRD